MYPVRLSGFRWRGWRRRRPRSAKAPIQASKPAARAGRISAGGAVLLLAVAACAGPRPGGVVSPESGPSKASKAGSGQALTPSESHGFRGMDFGASFSSVKHEMRLLARKGKWQFHSRNREDLTQGEAELTAVHYGFYRGKLLSVTIYAKGAENASKLLDWLESEYGAARPGEAGRMFWDHEQIRAIYEFNSANQTALLSVSSRKLLQVKELEEDR